MAGQFEAMGEMQTSNAQAHQNREVVCLRGRLSTDLQTGQPWKPRPTPLETAGSIRSKLWILFTAAYRAGRVRFQTPLPNQSGISQVTGWGQATNIQSIPQWFCLPFPEQGHSLARGTPLRQYSLADWNGQTAWL
jgi:hypothetical protein